MPDVSKILAMLAPIIMGFLGQQSRQQGQGGNLTDLLGGLMGGSGSSSVGGSILSSILKQAGGAQGKAGGLGDMLGGSFGKKYLCFLPLLKVICAGTSGKDSRFHPGRYSIGATVGFGRS